MTTTGGTVLNRAEAPLSSRTFEDLLDEAVRFHGDMCPGQVLGVRMTLAGCREIGIDHPKAAGKRLIVFAEIDRCATDAIEALSGVSIGKRTLKHVDYGKTAATFVNIERDIAVRVVARDDARAHASEWAPGISGDRQVQIVAYRVMPEPALLSITPVRIAPGWLDRRRVRNCHSGLGPRASLPLGSPPAVIAFAWNHSIEGAGGQVKARVSSLSTVDITDLLAFVRASGLREMKRSDSRDVQSP